MTAQRRNLLWWASGMIVLAIGVLGILHAIAFDARTVKAELEKRIEELHRIPDDDSLRKDALAHELLANESYKEHARALWLKVEREHPRLHDRARLERDAQREVPPFLARCKDLANVAADDLRRLHDECRTLLGNHGGSRYAARLQALLARLKAMLGTQDRVKSGDVPELQRAVLKWCGEEQFSRAMDQIADFLKRRGSSEFAGQVHESEQMVLRRSDADAVKLIADARKETREKGAKRIDSALARFKDLPAYAQLERARRELTTP